MHLPALVMTKQINKVLHAITKLGMTARGLYGEGTEASGNFFQVSNQVSMGRTEVDIEKIVNELQQKLSTLNRLSGGERLTRPVRMAVMGCVVNGPGEAEDADLAIAFGKKQGLLYKNSKPIRKVSSSEAVDELLKEWSKICTRS